MVEDRAHVIVTAIVQIAAITRDLAELRRRLEPLIRGELADLQRQISQGSVASFVPYRAVLGILVNNPDARLVLTFDRRYGDLFHIVPGGRQVRPEVTRALIRNLVVADAGLFPGLPQTWMHRCHAVKREARNA
jgi:hypothetical protein